METLNKILRSMMEFYGLDPETYHQRSSILMSQPGWKSRRKIKHLSRESLNVLLKKLVKMKLILKFQTGNMIVSQDRKRLTILSVISFPSTSGNQRENQDYVDHICKLSILLLRLIHNINSLDTTMININTSMIFTTNMSMILNETLYLWVKLLFSYFWSI